MIFEQATKMKLRFATARGQATVEDLWDIPLTGTTGYSLDDVAKTLNKVIKQTAEESFVVKKKRADATLELKMDIVKHIISVKLAERKAAKKAVEAKSLKDKAIAILAERQDEGMNDLSDKELKNLARG